MGNPNDADWFGADNNKYNIKKGKKKGVFRVHGQNRGSKARLKIPPALLPHKQHLDDPPVSS